jgi:hypothetical protein
VIVSAARALDVPVGDVIVGDLGRQRLVPGLDVHAVGLRAPDQRAAQRAAAPHR